MQNLPYADAMSARSRQARSQLSIYVAHMVVPMVAEKIKTAAASGLQQCFINNYDLRERIKAHINVEENELIKRNLISATRHELRERLVNCGYKVELTIEEIRITWWSNESK